MSTTLLRLGLWTLILVLVVYVLAAAYHDAPWTELVSTSMLVQTMVLAGLLIAAGIVLRVLGKGAAVVSKNRCKVCRAPVPPGAIYCRAHLRAILYDEEDRSHSTRVR